MHAIMPTTDGGFVIAWGSTMTWLYDRHSTLSRREAVRLSYDLPEAGMQWFETEEQALAFLAERIRATSQARG